MPKPGENSCKKLYISILSHIQVCNSDFIICTNFTHMKASSTAFDDVTNWVTHKISSVKL